MRPLSPLPRGPVRGGRRSGPVEKLTRGGRVSRRAQLAWAVGGVALFSVLAVGGTVPEIGLTLAGMSLVLAVVTVWIQREGEPTRTGPALGWALLGAGILVGLVVTQLSNPSLVFRDQGEFWWLESRDFVAWLPHGVEAPFAMGNGWRSGAAFGAAFLLWVTAASLMQDRTARRRLWQMLTVGGGLFALTGVVVGLTGTPRLLGLWEVHFPYHFSTIPYKGHAVAVLHLFASLTATEWSRARQTREDRESGWSLVAGCAFLSICLGLIMTRSAVGLCLLLGHLLINAPIFWSLVTRRGWIRWIGFAFALGVAAAVIGLRAPMIQDKWIEWREGKGEHSVESRIAAAKAGWAMWQERPLLGWGLGGFQYGFTKFKRDDPRLTTSRHLQLHWEHVHNDWLEGLIEVGLVGMMLLGCLLFQIAKSAGPLSQWVRWGTHRLWLGLIGLGLYAFVDFPLQSTAVVSLAAVTAALGWRKDELQRRSDQNVTT